MDGRYLNQVSRIAGPCFNHSRLESVPGGAGLWIELERLAETGKYNKIFFHNFGITPEGVVRHINSLPEFYVKNVLAGSGNGIRVR